MGAGTIPLAGRVNTARQAHERGNTPTGHHRRRISTLCSIAAQVQVRDVDVCIAGGGTDGTDDARRILVSDVEHVSPRSTTGAMP